MKKYIIIGMIAGLTVSCENFLDLGPANSINTQSFYKTPNDVQTVLVGAYSTLRDIHNINLHYMGDLTTDNAEIQLPNPSASEQQFDQMTFTPTNDYFPGFWSNCYRLITRCNTVLNHVDGVGFDDATKNSVQGQCLFLRAYGYFLLVRMFGEVSIVTEEFTSPNQVATSDLRRKPVEEVYSLIISDLTQAANFFPTAVPATKGQASIGAVKTLLAKVYLTRKEYAKALAELDAVMALKKADGSKAYNLQSDYSQLFKERNNDLAESIFEIEYASGNLGLGNSYASQFYPLLQGMQVFKGDLLGGGRCVPTQSLLDAYEPDDKRKEASVGDQLQVSNAMLTSRFCKKFIDYNVTILSDGGVNFTAFRYADILLMYAEASNETDRAGAETYLNEVRERAGLDPVSGLGKEDFRLAIEQERRVEFAFEQQRWFDLVRTGRLKDVMDAHFQSKGQAFTVADHRWLLPVPQSQRDIDPKLTQNPGY